MAYEMIFIFVAEMWTHLLNPINIAKSTSYLDLHLKIYSQCRLRTKLYDKGDDFYFTIVNFPFICSNIPATLSYGVYISQLIRYSRDCGSYHDFIDRGLLLGTKVLIQGFLMKMLKSFFEDLRSPPLQD